MHSILIVDDDVNLCTVLSEELKEVGFKVNSVNEGEAAVDFIKNNPVDLVLLDLKMPGKDGFYVLKQLHSDNVKTKVIVLTAYADVKSAVDSANLGANDFISKPYDLDELIISIRKVLQTENHED